MAAIKKIFNKIEKVIEYLSMATLLLLVCIVFMQVFLRYVFHTTPRWSEETAVILMIWLGFITTAIGVKKGMHLSISVIVDLLPKSMKKVMYCFDEVAVMVFGIILTIFGGQLALQTMDSTLPATQLPSGVLYAILPVSGALIVCYSVIRLFDVISDKQNKDSEVE